MSVPEMTLESNTRYSRSRAAVPAQTASCPAEIRALKSGFLATLTWIAAVLASVPLLSVIYMLFRRGGSRLNWET